MGSKLEVQQVRQQHPSIATHLRTDNRNIMSTLHQGPDGSRAVAAKGSPEEILQRCTHWMKDSTVHPLTEADREDSQPGQSSAGGPGFAGPGPGLSPAAGR